MSGAAGAGWGASLRAALGLGLTPAAFWALSLKEWRMLTAGEAGERPLSRAELEQLMERFDG